MNVISILQSNTTVFLVFIALLALAVGSFLNVVIHRLPIMMKQSWRIQCEEFLADTPSASTDKHPSEHSNKHSETFNLVTPNSRCPHCEKPIGALQNIPVVSYLILKGKCKNCSAPISPRYPLTETLTLLLSVITAAHFGFGWPAMAALVLVWSLIAASLIDYDTQLLPDDITLPLMWIGLLCNTYGLFCSLNDAVIGAIAGYLSLWCVYWLFKLLTGKEGMGYGDFKLLAMLGAWMGWQMLPAIVLISSFVGALFGISLILIKGRDKNIPIPFGPYLAIAGWICLLWGHTITDYYLKISGFH